jgi:hypothetical protein
MVESFRVWNFSLAMTDDRRIGERRTRDRRAPKAAEPECAAEPPPGQALVPVETPEPQADSQFRSRETRRAGFAGFAAQILGQGGQKRGLRGGPETLDRARSTYLGAEWSGAADRRPRPGRITKTEI